MKSLYQSISYIYDQSKNSDHSAAMFDKIDARLTGLAEYFNVTKNQAFLLAHILVINCKNDYFDIGLLGDHLNCNPIKLMKYFDDLSELTKKGILKKKRSKHGAVRIISQRFTMHDSVINAVISGKSLPEIKARTFNSVLDVLEELYYIGEKREREELTTNLLFEEMNEIIEKNLHFPLIKEVKKMEFDNEDAYLFFYLCWRTLTGCEYIDISDIADCIFSRPISKVNFVQKILVGDNVLIKNELIKAEESYYLNDTNIRLSEKGAELLKGENLKIFSKTRIKKDEVRSPGEITRKQLFFNAGEQYQLQMLEKMLLGQKFAQLQKRMKRKNMPHGITVLLYGAAGTGKTESALQLARKTGREIMQVDISNTKSMWFGQSEKKIKQIFTDYYDYLKNSKIFPILLFNEADAIFFKRKDNAQTSVEQTENIIQNIILEEMEKFKGILIATTNLTDNLDKAFERRFLFKIEFSQPDYETRKKIWRSKLKYLKPEESAILSEKYDFSGGQIDNIVRKCEMFEIIKGRPPKLMNIAACCEEELINNKKRGVIGFRKSSD